MAATEKDIYFSSPTANVTSTAIKVATRLTAKELKAKLRTAKINQKVASYVNDHFPAVSGLKVYQDNGVLVSKFMMNDRSVRTVFDAKGNWMYTIINGTEKDLAASDRRLVNNQYKAYSVTLVQEIRQADIICYKVFLEKSTKSTIIFVYEGEITVDKEFTN